MTEDEDRMTTAESYNLTLRSGRQVSITDVGNRILKNFAHKQLRRLKFEITRLNRIKDELERREYEGALDSLTAYKDYNVFQMTTHATILAMNTHNHQVKGSEEE
tara:strand:- start:329 stop:643 length:315 start_codon:yes stop_codon:yes gene_type:complete